MIICPNCNHQNPQGAVQCEACFTQLPQSLTCPECGAVVQADARFCGQCGSELRQASQGTENPGLAKSRASKRDNDSGTDRRFSELLHLLNQSAPSEDRESSLISSGVEPPTRPTADAHDQVSPFLPSSPDSGREIPSPPGIRNTDASNDKIPEAALSTSTSAVEADTQLQKGFARLMHVQTQAVVDLPTHLSLIRVGKPNHRVPPDLDVSGFPNSEIVSRVHASIRIEGDNYYIEDVGSSNGTYINNLPLPYGNRHRLRSGDRISLGKGDKVTFIFQIA